MCVLVTYKYDLHVGRPRIVENDGLHKHCVILSFRHYFCSHCVIILFKQFLYHIVFVDLFYSDKKLEGFSG